MRIVLAFALLAACQGLTQRPVDDAVAPKGDAAKKPLMVSAWNRKTQMLLVKTAIDVNTDAPTAQPRAGAQLKAAAGDAAAGLRFMRTKTAGKGKYATTGLRFMKAKAAGKGKYVKEAHLWRKSERDARGVAWCGGRGCG
jgi:hypothetical protein